MEEGGKEMFIVKEGFFCPASISRVIIDEAAASHL